uniref:Uncharacterized protein n=1 Tax=Solanum tuberosum TaxID=4113 RepID=M1DR38_SOLTU
MGMDSEMCPGLNSCPKLSVRFGFRVEVFGMDFESIDNILSRPGFGFGSRISHQGRVSGLDFEAHSGPQRSYLAAPARGSMSSARGRGRVQSGRGGWTYGRGVPSP